MNVNDFWQPWELEVSTPDQAISLIHDVFQAWSNDGSIFAWRGQVDASWALHSSLYRRHAWTTGNVPDEESLERVEADLLAEAHRWGLHHGEHGRLSALSQLAVLQHYGSPTRLIDVTFNPLIGLWFAVEEQWDNGTPRNEATDGRLFAIDVSERLINEDNDRRRWEDSHHRPWPRTSDADQDPFRDWTTKVRVWRPSRLDRRIAAQNGAFLVGGVPATSGPNRPMQWSKGPGSPEAWRIEEVRQVLSVPLKVYKLTSGAGRDPNNPAYTIRIKASAKPAIRKYLQDLYGYRHSTIYPDYPGFALHGWPRLKSRP